MIRHKRKRTLEKLFEGLIANNNLMFDNRVRLRLKTKTGYRLAWFWYSDGTYSTMRADGLSYEQLMQMLHSVLPGKS